MTKLLWRSDSRICVGRLTPRRSGSNVVRVGFPAGGRPACRLQSCILTVSIRCVYHRRAALPFDPLQKLHTSRFQALWAFPQFEHCALVCLMAELRLLLEILPE